jgi:flagellar protein FlbD
MRRECGVITLTRLKHGPFFLNPDLIEHIEMTPDTVIYLTTGHQYMVLESAGEVVNRIIEFRREICQSVRDSSSRNRTQPPESES